MHEDDGVQRRPQPLVERVDDLTLDVEVTEARVSQSRSTTGIVMFKMTASNSSGQVLCEMTSPIIVQRRDDAAS